MKNKNPLKSEWLWLLIANLLVAVGNEFIAQARSTNVAQWETGQWMSCIAMMTATVARLIGKSIQDRARIDASHE